ncbi:cytidine and deoxycytidylate deaminase [Grosmannia clavigera kw1407]|uniref:Cytidine and deoxycytidylate deaminase n=1 Tax=Grosmannia clavigera (strain kw1407 / UAMH 11150) TaxID=655863 RepID=F0XHN4_GROCL|nr:cytidine and deoxycytidylate deaminase [Grosmannia clavigera kw1407]EFX02841.1 cytidine and deoxycytidylate deaminase [Grosmannia clavigera kw1407]
MEPIAPADHPAYMRHALSLAEKSPPRPSNFRVGAVLVDAASGRILADGFTLELHGNTHAEQCCFMKLAAQHGVAEEDLSALPLTALPAQLALYTTMEPCSLRLSGNDPCVARVLRLAGHQRSVTVYVGVTEPDKFVAQNTGRSTLEAAGIHVVHVPGLETAILDVATAGHEEK